jgi:hypothetical protein
MVAGYLSEGEPIWEFGEVEWQGYTGIWAGVMVGMDVTTEHVLCAKSHDIAQGRQRVVDIEVWRCLRTMIWEVQPSSPLSNNVRA